MFWQAVLARRLCARTAQVVCHVKKNTYREHGGLVGLLKRIAAVSGIRQVDHFTATSAMTARMYRSLFRIPADRISVITQVGVDTEAFRPTSKELSRCTARGPIVVGYCGRLSLEKGVTDLIEAVDICRRDASVDLRLRLVGSGPLEDELRRQAAGSQWLETHSAVPNAEVPDFLAGLDIFVLPSRVTPDHEEHDAQVLLEALAAGVPAVGARSGIVPEILGDGTGCLVESADPPDLARAIHRLVHDDERRATLRATGREKAKQKFALAPVTRRRIEVYERVRATA